MSTSDVEKSTSDVEKSTSDVEKSTSDVEKSTSDVEKSTSDDNNSADLIKPSFEHDSSNSSKIKSAEENEEYWEFLNQIQNNIDRYQAENKGTQRIKQEFAGQIGSCRTTGCRNPRGPFGSKCSCGAYRTKF
jgi:hypothetical protein